MTGIRASKRLGQNFLVDPVLRDRLVEAAGLDSGDQVLEIGPGPGALTVPLAAACRRLVAVELDSRLVPGLRRLFAGRPEVEILEGDILNADLQALFPGGGHVVFGNIPYHLTGAILRRLLGGPPRPRRICLVVQEEVAERWVSDPPDGVSALLVRLHTEPRLTVRLPRTAFQPTPKVDSAQVVMEVLDRPRVPEAQVEPLIALAAAGFGHRRKTLRNSLVMGLGLPPAEVAERLAAAGIEADRRPQSLTVEEWWRLLSAFG